MGEKVVRGEGAPVPLGVPTLPSTSRVAVALANGDHRAQRQALNLAAQLGAHQGAISVEVVAYGPGLRLLLAESRHAAQISTLGQAGVRFSACARSVAAMRCPVGGLPALHACAKPVPLGVLRLVELGVAGYTVIHPC